MARGKKSNQESERQNDDQPHCNEWSHYGTGDWIEFYCGKGTLVYFIVIYAELQSVLRVERSFLLKPNVTGGNMCGFGLDPTKPGLGVPGPLPHSGQTSSVLKLQSDTRKEKKRTGTGHAKNVVFLHTGATQFCNK